MKDVSAAGNYSSGVKSIEISGDVDEFIKICSRFIGKGSCEMDHRVAQALLDKFRELVGE